MNKRVDTIIEEARKLTPEERDELMRRLPLELDEAEADGTPEEIEAAWAEEIDRRIEKAERGESKGISHDELIAELRKLARGT